MVPSMLILAMLCYLQCVKAGINTEESESQSLKMINLLSLYKNMPKSDWNEADKTAFVIANDYYMLLEGEKDKIEDFPRKPWTLLNLAMLMVMHIRCTWWMRRCDLIKLLEMLDSERSDNLLIPSEEMSYLVIASDIFRQLGDSKKILQIESSARALVSKLNKKDAGKGQINVISLNVACLAFEMKDVGLAQMMIEVRY